MIAEDQHAMDPIERALHNLDLEESGQLQGQFGMKERTYGKASQ